MPTPIQQIQLNDVTVLVKRDDLNDTEIQGNKLRKLKYNMQLCQHQGRAPIITFGGAFSNHIAATAAAGKRYAVPTIGLIRGDELADKPQQWSETLRTARRNGMQLLFVSRSDYRLKSDGPSCQKLLSEHPQAVVIPEGGSNALGVRGVAELIDELRLQLNQMPTHIVCACGTGGTLAGLIEGVAAGGLNIHIWGIAVHCTAQSVRETVQQLAPGNNDVPWQVFDSYHFGGYAKRTAELENFARDFRLRHGIVLDRVYNCKSFFALNDLVHAGAIGPSDRPLIVHTGGLQGGDL